MNKKRILIIIVPALTFILILPLFYPRGDGKINFFVPSGAPASIIEKKLDDAQYGITHIYYSISLRLNILLHGPVKPGYYHFERPVSIMKIHGDITSGKNYLVTIPEGFTQREIAVTLEKIFGQSKYLDNLKKLNPDYEGFLFPATYKVDVTSPPQFIKKMMITFKKRTKDLSLRRRDVILASIIQKEGARRNEFRRISGVFHNRILRNMKLESDPTLQYIVGKIRLTKEVLKNKSGYNTYMYKGMPPGPICNPGLSAIKAAINPEKHHYFYFVSKKNGYHYFSVTKQEHFRAVGYYQLGYDNGFIPNNQK